MGKLVRPRSLRSLPGAVPAGAFALALLARSVAVRAELPADASRPPSPPETDGPWIAYGTRPTLDPEAHGCSFRLPICVHAPRATDPPRVARVLAAVERAWDASAWGLGLPTPDTDPDTGAFDVYVVAGVPWGARAELAGRDPIASFDRARSFLLADANLAGCALDAAVARELARASLFRVAPATDPATARAETSYLARLMVPCAAAALDGVDVFQAHPEVSVAGLLGKTFSGAPHSRPADEFAAGAGLFYWWLDDSFGNSPGAIVRALWALSPTRTPWPAARWTAHPDGFDVLRVSFKDALTQGSTLDDLFLDFAVARAFAGDASDADHLPETRALGSAGRPRSEWAIEWPVTPRTLASGRGVEPTGAAYVAIDCRVAPKGARLRFEARWEEHAKMRWAAVKVDAALHERGAVAIAAPDRGTEARATIVDLDGVDRVLFVGVNTGDPFSPLEPAREVLEPHGYTVSVAAESPP